MRMQAWGTKSRVPVVLALVLALVGAGSWWLVTSSHDAPRTSPAPAPGPPPPTPAPAQTIVAAAPSTTTPLSGDPGGSRLRLGVARPVSSPATIASATGPRVPLFSEAGDDEPGDVVDNPTHEGLPVTFLVMEKRGEWLNVQLSRRPNMATAWVRTADVTTRETPYKILVNTATHRLVLTELNRTVFEAPVAVGTGGTPTPTGTYFVDGTVKLIDPTGPYGTYQLSVAAFSEVLTSFGGGNGQIAIHGTNRPGLMGSSVSNGCVRMTNDDIDQVAATVPVGTPVEIS